VSAELACLVGRFNGFALRGRYITTRVFSYSTKRPRRSIRNILGNMHDILKGRTAVIIAHRLSTIMRADKILVLYEGAIVEQGRHDELIQRGGMYYQLVQKQLSA
jgi:ABC-type sugar transport system ATPase subunit